MITLKTKVADAMELIGEYGVPACPFEHDALASHALLRAIEDARAKELRMYHTAADLCLWISTRAAELLKDWTT